MTRQLMNEGKPKFVGRFDQTSGLGGYLMGDFGKSVEATSDFEVRLVTTESATYTITQLKNDTKYGLRLKHKSTQYEYRFCAQ